MADDTSKEPILSNDYADLIIYYNEPDEELLARYASFGVQIVGSNFAVIYVPREQLPQNPLNVLGYYNIPKLLTPLDTTSLEKSGILRLRSQTVLNLDASNVMLGFIDTGIDYTLDVFKNTDGTSRIMGIWDQTVNTGPAPYGLLYGTGYTNAQINEALTSENPLEFIPVTDEIGHGTAVAGVAAGSPDPQNDFTGASPSSPIAVVKLKPAKEYLKEFFLIQQDAIAYQEDDMMLGVRYLYSLAKDLGKELVLCIGMGTNLGPHSGDSPLSSVLTYYSRLSGVYCVIAAGNEAGKAHHYYGNVQAQGDIATVEILVDEKDQGFTLELWARPPELYAVSFLSPLGESVPLIPARLNQQERVRFVLESTQIDVSYTIVETLSGSELILMRFLSPTPGIWTVRIQNQIYLNGNFHMWLPITGFISPDTYFLAPNPDTTLTVPAPSPEPVTLSTYNAYDDSLFINSSRGYTIIGQIKPDLAAPGVEVTSPLSGGRFAPRTGSSMAAAITAGAVALLVAWGITRPVPRLLTNAEVKNFLIRGATRSPNLLYPNREWGYGTLNLYQIFENLM